MGATDSHSPARRPQNERSASAHSLSRGSPSDSALAKSHKGSSRQLHKAHAVGHGRHPHARVPSYGKGLHKLSKLGHGAVTDAVGPTRGHTRSASDSPSTSPPTIDFNRNSSHTSLPRTGSKVSFKKNHSEVSLSRNGSTTKLGNKSKSEKAQTKANLRKKGTNDAPVKGTASFQVGEDAQDDEWTEDSSSPYTTRQNSAAPSRPKTPLARDPPSPDHSQDDPPEASPNNLPHSPPESPHPDLSESDLPSATMRSQRNGERKPSHYDPPDPQAVTNRLLNRSTVHHAPLSQTSTVSASITPPARSRSPSEKYGSGTTLVKDQSMPANGISRFLDTSSLGADSATPGSVSHLQSNLAHLDRETLHRNHHPHPASSSSALHNPASKPPKSHRDPDSTSHRSKSASTLNRTLSSTSTPSPPVSPSHQPPKPGPSPFESARGADPTAGKSLTQLKLDLQRLSTQRADAPRDPHNNPLLMNGYGGMLNTVGLGLGGGETDMAARVGRQWESARKEVEGAKRFWPDVVRGSLVARQRVVRGEDVGGAAAGRRYNVKLRQTVRGGSSLGSDGGGGGSTEGSGSVQGRGRIRFEVGSNGRNSEDGGDENGGLDGGDLGGEMLEGLVRRMWVGGEVGAGE